MGQRFQNSWISEKEKNWMSWIVCWMVIMKMEIWYFWRNLIFVVSDWAFFLCVVDDNSICGKFVPLFNYNDSHQESLLWVFLALRPRVRISGMMLHGNVSNTFLFPASLVKKWVSPGNTLRKLVQYIFFRDRKNENEKCANCSNHVKIVHKSWRTWEFIDDFWKKGTKTLISWFFNLSMITQHMLHIIEFSICDSECLFGPFFNPIQKVHSSLNESFQHVVWNVWTSAFSYETSCLKQKLKNSIH